MVEHLNLSFRALKAKLLSVQINRYFTLFQPLRPFIITKDNLQKTVYGLGYPSIPTMTIEEFFDKKVEEGTLHEHGLVTSIRPCP